MEEEEASKKNYFRDVLRKTMRGTSTTKTHAPISWKGNAEEKISEKVKFKSASLSNATVTELGRGDRW